MAKQKYLTDDHVSIDDDVEDVQNYSDLDVNVASSSENVEDSEDELLSETRDRLLANNTRSYNSKAGMTWTSQHPPVTRRRAHNIATFLEGLQNESEAITSIKEAFQLFFSEGMMNKICLNTNLRGKAVVAKWNERNPDRQKIRKNVTMNELHAFMGILLTAGRNHGRRLHITEMWCKGELVRQPLFTVAMPRDRYKEIFRNIRFDDPTTRAERIENTKDKLPAIRTLYDQFTQNCIRQYSPGANITVDESLATFRGKCPFRVYMKSKPGRYGIKIWVCADSKTGQNIPIKSAIDMFLRETEKNLPGPNPNQELGEIQANTSKRCNFYPRKRDRKSSIVCTNCKKIICVIHRQIHKEVLCPECGECAEK
ncbi:hypothetical protein JTB14_020780 [Gonioctena quinquepunctata]|nr:hypothetical protein JTB14_020780 [Gonioctena quinquepunctata]